MATDGRFVEGEWYVSSVSDGRSRAHFFTLVRTGYARASCGVGVWNIVDLLPSDDIDAMKTSKVNPRKRCANCWSAECVKARRT